MRHNSPVLRFLILSLMVGAAVAVQACDVSCAVARYRSNEPVCARVALNADSSMTLRVVFDESQGTGAGYDVLYATVESNGRAGPTQTLKASPRRQPTGIRCDFPPIRLTARHNNPARKVTTSYPCEIVFGYEKYSSVSRGVAMPLTGSQTVSARKRESFSVSSTISLRGGSDEWRYTFRGSITPSRDLSSAPTWKSLESPTITVTTKPDGRNPGNLGIGLSLVAGPNELECRNGRVPLKAYVEVKAANGKVVHQGSSTLDKFTFG
ncbi:MAG: hypothetical protein Q8Q12_21740 [bacterium]|nr:hypothetical protein [bacterium]